MTSASYRRARRLRHLKRLLGQALIIGGAGSTVAFASLVSERRWERAAAGDVAPDTAPARHTHVPVVVIANPLVDPVVVRAKRVLKPERLLMRAKAGEPMRVEMTAYCLRGRTRRGNLVREGIIAADPRVFPLGRHVELFIGTRSLGRFLVDDTGGVIKGAIVDVWMPSCAEARIFGRRKGTAVLVQR
jgi:3D (Asp-Asp-Asp) domain-containing protein